MNSNKEIFGWLSTGVSATATVASTVSVEEILSMVMIVVAIVSGLLSIAYTSYKWYKRVTSENSDGGVNITPKEVFEGLNEVTKSVEEAKKVVEVVKDGDKNK